MRNHIFISYRWGDRESDDNFRELVTEIEQTSGLTAFWDTRELRSGNFVNVLQENVISADIFMPIVTENYIKFGKEGGRDEDKDYCLFEYASAVAAGKKIVPIFCGVEGNTKIESYDKAKAAAKKVLDLDYSDEDIKLLKEYLILQNGVSLGMLNVEDIQKNNGRLCSLIFDTFCSTESDIIFYKKHLENLSATLDPIRIFGNFDDSGLTLGNSYIPLSFLRHLTKSERREKESMKESTAPTDSSENDLTTALEKERLAVVVGDAGQGKSSFVRHLSIKLAKKAQHFGLSRELFFPLYFECKSIDRDSMSSHDTFLHKLAEKAGFSKPALEAVMRFGKPLFIFDAMDEVSPGQMDALTEAIYKYIYLKNEKAHILFTSRPGQRLVAGNDDMTLNNGGAIVRKYSVKEFDEMQRESYICALASAKKTAPKEKDAFVRAINKKEMEIADYRSISRSPFMLFAIFSTYVKGQDLPDNRFDAICRIIDDIIQRDIEKTGCDMFESQNIKEILGAVSCTFNRQRDDGITPHLNSDAPFNCARKIYQLDDSDSYDRKLINKYREFFSHNDLLDENGFRHEFLAATYAAYYLFFLMKRKVRKGNSPIEVKEISSLKKNTDYWKSVSEALLCLLDRESEDSKTYIEPLLEEMQKEETPNYDLLCNAVSQFTKHQPRAAGALLSGMLERGCIGILTGNQTDEGLFVCQKGVNPYEELFYYTAVYPYLQQYLSNLTAGERQDEELYLYSELIKEVCSLFSNEPEEELHNVYSGRIDAEYEQINTKLEDAAYRTIEDCSTEFKGYVMLCDKGHYNCSQSTNIYISQDVDRINTSFEWCINLTGIIVNHNNAVYSSADGVLFDKNKTKIICCPHCKTGKYSIPRGVTKIGEHAFNNCENLTDIVIPHAVTEICNSAFSRCTNLTSISIPDGVTEIGSFTFSNCKNLASVIVDHNNAVYSSIDGVFFNKSGSKLICCPPGKTGEYTIPHGVTEIGSHAFENCTYLTSITVPDNVSKIGFCGFYNCENLTSIKIFNSVKEIGDLAFRHCTGLTSITIPNSITEISAHAFEACTGLISITMPNSVNRLESCSFAGCTSLTNITIPDSVTEIGSYAFEGCTSLTNITISDSVTKIEHSAFKGCTSMTNINISINNALYSSNYGVLLNKDKTVLIKCPVAKTGTYTIPDSVTQIGDDAFSGCAGLTSIVISSNITKIGLGAFANCTGLTNMTIPDSVMKTGYYAFEGCTGLTSITIPDSMTKIGYYEFAGCANLTSIAIPSAVTEIGMYAFKDCSSLTSMKIPNSVIVIGSHAFTNCTGLTNITIPDSVTVIGDSAFETCPKLTIHAPKGSYAEAYAKENGIPFVEL